MKHRAGTEAAHGCYECGQHEVFGDRVWPVELNNVNVDQKQRKDGDGFGPTGAIGTATVTSVQARNCVRRPP